jgi:hypothetical protein
VVDIAELAEMALVKAPVNKKSARNYVKIGETA